MKLTPAKLAVAWNARFQAFAAVALTIVVGIALTTTPIATASSGHPSGATSPVLTVASVARESTASVDSRILERLHADGSVEAIVTFRHKKAVPGGLASNADSILSPRTLARVRQVLNAMERTTLALPDVTVVKRWDNLPTSLVRIGSQEALDALLADPNVASIDANDVFRSTSGQHLSVIRQPEAQQSGYVGDGKVVAVLDSGMDFRHPDLGSCSAPGEGCRVVGMVEIAPDDGKLDSTGHGSNVGGIVAKVAPAVRLLSYDIFRSDDLTNSVLILTAMNHLIGLKSQGLPVVAANMSLGGGAFSGSDCSAADPKLAAAFEAARSAGIIPVVSSGNDAKGGQAPRGVSYPGCIASALTVGATYDTNVGRFATSDCQDRQTFADKVTCFSQTGRALDILAPGVEITAGGVTMSGTSMAAPHVAGAVAVLAAASPSATPAQIEAALVTTGPVVTDSRYTIKYARHRLDVYAAVQKLLGGGGGRDTTPPVVSVPQAAFGTTISDTSVDVRISWSASDRGGVAGYELWARTNGGAWTVQTAVSPTATSWTFALAFDSKYEFAVRARDRAGNWSAYQSAAPITPIATDDTVFQVADGSWQHYQWPNVSFRGTGITTSMPGAWINYTFTGRDVALVAPRHADGGRAQIYCDGVLKGNVDLLSATLRPKELVFRCSFAQHGQHSMRVVVEGTPGRPRFDVDGFIALT